MELSYTISKAEYLRAYKLYRKHSLRSWIMRLFWFWCFLFICLMLLWVIVQRSSNQATIAQHPAVESVAPVPAKTDYAGIAQAVVIAGAWIFVVFILPKMRLSWMYRRDPSMQGQFTVNITSDSISVQNTAGTSSRTGWNVYDYWRERKNVIALVLRSGAFLPLSTASLSEAQRAELRSTLTVALPKK